MFETAVIAYGPANNRIRTTCLGISGEALLLTCAALAPMVWPEALHRPQAAMTWLMPPAPLAPRANGEAAKPRAVRAEAPPVRSLPGWMFEPRTIPAQVTILVDPPAAESPTWGVEGALAGGYPNARAGEWLENIFKSAPAPAMEAPAVRTPADTPVTPRVKVGGLVKMARPVRRPAPVYPAVARAARISGAVELIGVIGVDGRMRELKVVRGHPLLVGAALDAVRQWVYEPTRLNGVPVEVEAPVTVTFHLD